MAEFFDGFLKLCAHGKCLLASFWSWTLTSFNTYNNLEVLALLLKV